MEKVIGITFDQIASKLQDELAEIIATGRQVDDYGLIVYKYVFISELKMPLVEDLGFEMAEDAFVLHVIADDLEFSLLRRLDDAFDRFQISFMPGSYGIIKLKFTYIGD